MRRRWLLALLAAWTSGCFLAACQGPAVVAPAPDLRATSVHAFGIDVEFASPLDRSSAETAAHYAVHPVARLDSSLAIHSVSLVDSVYGRTVLILVPDGMTDGADYVVSTSGVRCLSGKSTGDLQASLRAGLSYQAPLRALFAQHCDACHGAARADGSYRTDSYAALLGGGTNATPNLIAGNPRCQLLVKTKPQNSMFNQGKLTWLDYDVIYNWVVNYQARQ
jgi:hypothetical protein